MEKSTAVCALICLEIPSHVREKEEMENRLELG